MSLMRKMARIIQRDMKKSATRQYPYDGQNYGHTVRNKEDYVYAAAYKDEQQELWRTLYKEINNLKLIVESYIPFGDEKDWVDSIKQSAHNYYVAKTGPSPKVESPQSMLATVHSQVINVRVKKKMTEEQLKYHESGRGEINQCLESIKNSLNQIDWEIYSIKDESNPQNQQ